MEENKWTDALNICRTVNNEITWTCLAVLATQPNSETLDIAEEAFANINHHEKVLYIQYIKVFTSIHENSKLILSSFFTYPECPIRCRSGPFLCISSMLSYL